MIVNKLKLTFLTIHELNSLNLILEKATGECLKVIDFSDRPFVSET